jgi:CubicO group peptidase (beta-lactamase class C family)
MRATKTLLSLFICSIINTSIFAQQPTYSAAVEERIKKVENNLGEAIKTDDIPITLQERMKLYGVPGLSIAVIKDYKIDWVRGYGVASKEKGNAVTPLILFQAASLSKSVNAVGVLNLVQNKKLDLDKDINSYLTTWKFPYDTAKGKKTITPRHLLSHTAGTSVHGFRGYAAGETIPTVIQVLNGEAPANSQPVKSLFDAGTKVQYSGGGITISQLIVMDVSGQPYDVYMQKNVLQPLAMKNSFYSVPPPADRMAFLSTGYCEDGTTVKGGYHSYPENAAASLWTTPADLANFIIEMQLASVGKSKKVLDQKFASLMLAPVMGDAALGVFIKNVGDEQYFGHGSANEGFRSTYFGSKKGGNGVVVMVNSDNGAIMNEVVNSVATVYGWKDFYKPVFRKTIAVAPEVLDEYIGEYELAPQFKITIRRDGVGLLAKATNQGEIKLYAEERNKFFIKEVDAKIEFVKDSSGKVSKLILYQNGRNMDGKKIN